MTTPFVRDGAAPVGPMFDAFRAARRVKMPRWAAPLLIAMAVFHVLLFVAMWARSVWDLDQLDPTKQVAEIWLPPSPPPPPPPPPGALQPQVQPQVMTKKVVVRDLVQLVKLEDKPPPPAPPSDEVICDPAIETCSDGPGKKDGVLGAPPAPPEPPAPPKVPPVLEPRFVPPTAIEGQFLSGNRRPLPDDTTKQEIKHAGKDKIVGAFTLCLTAQGGVASVTMRKGTGFPAYDAKIQREMNGWRYRPYMVNEMPIPVCTSITFIYTQPL